MFLLSIQTEKYEIIEGDTDESYSFIDTELKANSP